MRMTHFSLRVEGCSTSFDRAAVVESCLSQTLSGKVNNCDKEEPNSRRLNATLAFNHYADCTHEQLLFTLILINKL